MRRNKRSVVVQETFLNIMALTREHLPKGASGNWPTQLLVLMTIWEGGPVSATEMAKRSGIPRPTCIRVAEELKRRRMVRKNGSLYVADERHLKKLHDAAFFRDTGKLIADAAKRLNLS
jgi:DNA-binding MarR family transcriptional regulator